jgi:hypothetical protein
MSTNVTVSPGVPARRRLRRPEIGRWTRGFQAFYATLLAGTVVASLLPTVLFQPNSRVFLLKLAAAALLASLPGLLYLEFIRFKGQTLYDEYVINLFRLGIDQDRNLPAPPTHTSYYGRWKQDHDKLENPGKDNLYRKKFEAVYGQQAVSTRSQFADPESRPERSEGFLPVLLATVLLCVGWALVVQPELYRDIDLLGGLPFSGRPELPVEALQYGFIGAYWFILQDVIRRYFRDDLKTAAYVSASARIILVVIVVTMVSLVPIGSSTQQNVLAFFIGIFPQIGVQILKAALTTVFKGVVPSLESSYPLSDLEGLTIWDQARLLEEGIEDMHGLVTANLVDVLLRTRIPIDRLVDWLDQALLYLHVPKELQGRHPRAALRALAIRTATDLERAWGSDEQGDPAVRRQIATAVAGTDETAAPATVRMVLDAFRGNASFLHVQQFKRHEWLDRANADAA